MAFWCETALYTAGFLTILVLVFALLAPWNRVYDLSPEKSFSFGTDTLKLAAKFQEEPVKLIGFFLPDDPVVREIQAVLPSLRRYLPRLTFEAYHLTEDPDAAKRYGIHEDGILLLEAGRRRTSVLELSETGLASALGRLATPRAPFIFFLSGHEEVSLEDRGMTGFSFLRDRLENEAYTLKQAPADSPYLDQADVLVVAYPKSDLTKSELERIQGFLKTRSAIWMIDPEEKGRYPKLFDFFKRLGVSFGDDVVVDRASRFFGADDLIPVVSDFTHHRIVSGFQAPLFFPLSRSVQMLDDVKSSEWERDYLVFSGKDSWGEVDFVSLEQGNFAFDPAKDAKGPLPLALALESKKSPHNRMLVFGDSDFTNNTNFNAGGNRFLFLNSLAWSLKEKPCFGPQRLKRAVEPWVMSERSRPALLWLVVVLPPALSLLVLGGIFLFRRLST